MLEWLNTQAMTYKEDFETERKDRESAHSKMAETETRYTHQLETLAAQLQATAAELQRYKKTLANTEEELQTSYVKNKQLQVSEDCMCL